MLEVEGEQIEGESGEDGVVRAAVPERAEAATLTLRPAEGPELRLELRFDLPSPDEVAGAQARLNNLGFAAGPEDGQVTAGTAAALGRFQYRHGLSETQDVDSETLRRLEEAHGG